MGLNGNPLSLITTLRPIETRSQLISSVAWSSGANASLIMFETASSTPTTMARQALSSKPKF